MIVVIVVYTLFKEETVPL